MGRFESPIAPERGRDFSGPLFTGLRKIFVLPLSMNTMAAPRPKHPVMTTKRKINLRNLNLLIVIFCAYAKARIRSSKGIIIK
jgi:hypothetical protein